MKDNVTSAWVDPSWLSWGALMDGATGYDPCDITARPYETHQHACDRLAGDPSEFDRVDAITTLKRIVSRRVKELNENYCLRELPTGPKPKYNLALLEYFGIIRPFMLKRLIDIRNFVEHEDSIPPPTDECLMFADLVWYFLRSTDKIAHGFINIISFELRTPIRDDDENEFFKVSVLFGQPFNKPPEIRADIDPAALAYEPRENWTRIEAAEITRSRYERPDYHQIYVRGNMSGTNAQMKYIYDLYFKFSHFS
jgi:hypothetical protein